jgi:hypothetical protein
MLLRNIGRCFNKHVFIYRKTRLFSDTAVRTPNLVKQSFRRCSRCHQGSGTTSRAPRFSNNLCLEKTYFLSSWYLTTRFPAESRVFSLLKPRRVHTRSASHPASCSIGTGGLFPPGVTHPVREADRSLLSSAELLKYLLRPKVMYTIGTSQYICYMLGTQTNISTPVHNNQISSQERSNARIFSQNKF